MRNIAICTPEISYNDAVSNDVFGMYDVLVKKDCNVSIFAEVILTGNSKVKHIDQIGDFIKDSSDILIYHLSIGWIKGFQALEELNCKKVIKYHNITPPYFFYNFSNDHVKNCRGGIEQLKKIATMNLDLYMGASDFNMNELVLLGADRTKCHVTPPFNNVERLRKDIAPDFDILGRFNDGSTNLLSVGRISPNKGFEKLIEFFYYYNTNYNPDSRLIIVGNRQPVLSTYTDYLDSKIERFGLQDKVIMTGKVGNEALKSYYLLSNIFVMTSYHEGFCVPLIEAMYLKIPIVAYNSTAVGYTLGGAGILLDELDEKLFCSALNRIVKNEDTYHEIGLAGWERYQENYKKDKIEKEFLNIVSEFL